MSPGETGFNVHEFMSCYISSRMTHLRGTVTDHSEVYDTGYQRYVNNFECEFFEIAISQLIHAQKVKFSKIFEPDAYL